MAEAVRHHAVQVPATSANLGPGFDAFGVALDRYLAVRSVDRVAGGPRIEMMGDDELPDGDDNLVWRALVTFCGTFDVEVPDVGLRVASEIPLERGLGSSSSAIVGGLVLARALTAVPVGDLELLEVAIRLEGHADNVAPALLGGLVACAPAPGPSARAVVRRINPAAHLRPLLLVPPFRQSTTGARAVLPESMAGPDVAAQAARAGHVLAGLAGAWPVAVDVAGDLLHEPARFAQMPAAGDVVGDLRAAGIHAWLSGAGPSVAAALPRADGRGHAVAREVAARHGFELVAGRFELSGALACPEGGCGIAGTSECVQCPRRRV